MILQLLLLIPFLGALFCYLLRPGDLGRWWRPYIVSVVGITHLTLTLYCVARYEGQKLLGGWLVLDPIGSVFLLSLSTLFACCALYAPSYLHMRVDFRNRIFCVCLNLLLGICTLVFLAHHLGLLWVTIEATTLASAPLLYFNRSPLSLEAVWKYLLICSVGIALALLGSLFLAYSSITGGSGIPSLLIDQLLSGAPLLSKTWLHMAFVTLLVGYGTKMGIAPLHTWKPDAYGEAPGLAGALLAGGVTSCAFIAIIRTTMIMHAAGEFAFAAFFLKGFGIFSVLLAAMFLVRQRDFKRMLAYSSVEHMGILILGLGIGGLGTFAALFHMINNALSKGIVFLAAGNIHRAYGSKSTERVQGALRVVPWSASLLLLGFFAITGSPPFSPFLSEFTLVQSMINGKHFLLAFSFLTLLLIAFMGIGQTVLGVTQGNPPEMAGIKGFRDSMGTTFPILILTLLIFVIGVNTPAFLTEHLERASRYLETGT